MVVGMRTDALDPNLLAAVTVEAIYGRQGGFVNRPSLGLHVNRDDLSLVLQLQPRRDDSFEDLTSQS